MLSSSESDLDEEGDAERSRSSLEDMVSMGLQQSNALHQAMSVIP